MLLRAGVALIARVMPCWAWVRMGFLFVEVLSLEWVVRARRMHPLVLSIFLAKHFDAFLVEFVPVMSREGRAIRSELACDYLFVKVAE